MALVWTTRYDGPWELPTWHTTRAAYLRLLSRAGFLSNHRAGEHDDVVDATAWGHLLLADSAADAIADVMAYEKLYGRCDATPNWLKDPQLLTELLNHELLTMAASSWGRHDLSQVAGQWPAPKPRRLQLLLQRLRRVGAQLDDG